jgi:hypothetical protein
VRVNRAHEVWLGVALVLSFVTISARTAHGEICGDADAGGTVTVTDGVQTLRAAADLPTTCVGTRCDVDGSGTVTVTDGVAVLRIAAGLAVDVRCGTGAGHFVTRVLPPGDPALLQLGAPPTAASNAPMTISSVTGDIQIDAGGSNPVTIVFDLGGGSAEAGQATLIVAVKHGSTFEDGFFEFPLTQSQGQVTVTVQYPADLGNDSFTLEFATRDQGTVGKYVSLDQEPNHTNPTATATPTTATATPTAHVATATPTPQPTATINPGVGCIQAIPVCFDDPQQGTTNFATCAGTNNTLDQSACTEAPFTFCHYRQCNIDQICGSAEACCPQTCECTGPPGNPDCP